MENKKIYAYIGVVFLLIITVSFSYAYFNIKVTGNDISKNMVVEVGTLKLTYTDSPQIVANNIKPGWSTTKVVTIKNTGTLDTAYNIIWQELTNTIFKNELVISATCKRLNASGAVEGTCEPIDELPVRAKRIAKNISIESGFTHEYTFTFLFKETNSSQDYNQGKEFNGVLGIEEYKDTAVYCTFDGELKQGAVYVNGQYTYAYKQQGNYALSRLDWSNISNDGWGVQLTDRNSTEPVTSKLCTYINNKPVVSMSHMFLNSKATIIDLSNFDTSNVTDMSYMFDSSQATTLDVSNFDTSNVTNMLRMFYESQATTLDVSNFDTSNVTDMRYMFSCQATTLNLSNFDTSKVTRMGFMFRNSQATTLDLSSFDTSNVTDMAAMFINSKATTLDLSNFDTSKVTSMGSMFRDSQVTTLDVSNFDTSKVTSMGSMFRDSQATTLDVNNFDTSNVTDMRYMFYISQATTLDVNNFDTSNVTNMSYMFSNSQATTLDVSNFDTSNVTNMSDMFYKSQATALDLSNFDTSKVTDMSFMFSDAANLKAIYTGSKFNTNNVTSSTYMFRNCTNLVGGAGTKYDSSKVDKTYARIDGGTSNPGYFTSK